MIRKTISVCFCFLLLVLISIVPIAKAEKVFEMTTSDFAEQLDAFLIENSTYETYETVPAGDEDRQCSISSNRLIVFDNSNDFFEKDCGAVSKLEGYNGIHIFQYETDADTEYAYSFFSSKPDIEYVEYDKVQLIDDLVPTQNEIELSGSKSVSSLSYGTSKVKSAEAVSAIKSAKLTNSMVTVAVIDTGVDENHSFFKTSTGENRILSSNRPKDNHPSTLVDRYYHGTHVAGIIVDNTPENVKIRSYNHFYYRDYTDDVVTSTLSLYETIELAASNNADVINMSICGNGQPSTIQKSVNNAISKGIIVVSAAGNDNQNASNYYPAYIESLITVAATDSSNKPWYTSSASASNYGTVVDIAAPGASIYSTMPNNSYASKTGTSMATPFVSAACAILKTVDKSVNCSTASQILTDTSTVPSGWNNSKYGSGIVNYYSMLSHQSVRIAEPTIRLNPNGKYTISSAAGSNAKYYYTLDGSEPTINSKLYSSAFSVNNGSKSIKAIAVVGPLKSKIAQYNLISYFNKKINYKQTVKLDIPQNAKIRSIYSDDEKIVSIVDPYEPSVYGAKKGSTTVTVNFDAGRTYNYNVTVDYSFWQWIIRLLFFGFLWM